MNNGSRCSCGRIGHYPSNVWAVGKIRDSLPEWELMYVASQSLFLRSSANLKETTKIRFLWSPNHQAWAPNPRAGAQGAVNLITTRIRLLALPKSMRSIIDATQLEQRYGLAWIWRVGRNERANKTTPQRIYASNTIAPDVWGAGPMIQGQWSCGSTVAIRPSNPCCWSLYYFYDKADLGESGHSSKLQRMAALSPT